MAELHTLLAENPVGLLFLVVGIGCLIGEIRIASFALRPVTGVLFAGLVLGLYGYKMSTTVQTMGFVALHLSRRDSSRVAILHLPAHGRRQRDIVAVNFERKYEIL